MYGAYASIGMVILTGGVFLVREILFRKQLEASAHVKQAIKKLELAKSVSEALSKEIIFTEIELEELDRSEAMISKMREILKLAKIIEKTKSPAEKAH